jgi:hypothetical protein
MSIDWKDWQLFAPVALSLSAAIIILWKQHQEDLKTIIGLTKDYNTKIGELIKTLNELEATVTLLQKWSELCEALKRQK